MVVITGKGMYGKTDIVPGFFYVVTEFGHLNYFPMLPLATYVVLAAGGVQKRIPMSFKSVLTAWVRAGMLLAGLILPIVAIVNWSGRNGNAVVALLAAVGCWSFFVMTYKFGRAGVERAVQLAKELGLPPEAMEEAFGKDAVMLATIRTGARSGQF